MNETGKRYHTGSYEYGGGHYDRIPGVLTEW